MIIFSSLALHIGAKQDDVRHRKEYFDLRS